MNFKKIIGVIIAVSMVLLLVGCGGSSAGKTGESITDRNGKTIVVPSKVDSIVCLSSPTTQVIVDLGLEDKLVATDEFSLPYIENQSMETLDIMNPSIEKLLALDADVYFVTDMNLPPDTDPMTALTNIGATVVYVPVSSTIDEIRMDVILVANVLGETSKGEALIGEMDKVIAKYEEVASKIATPKRVYFEIDTMPDLYSFGSGVYLNEVLGIIGAENIFAAETGWIQVSVEKVLAADPDVIITNVNYLDDPIGDITSRPGFDQIKAVEDNRVFLVPNFTSANSNHRIVQTIELLAATIYPSEYAGI